MSAEDEEESPSSATDAEEEAFYSNYWDHVATKEKSIYGASDYSGKYRPGEKSVTMQKLNEAVWEFLRRYDENDDDSEYCAVLVAQNTKETPDRSMERAALQQGTHHVQKLWYARTVDGDLMIIKVSSGDIHSKCVHKIGHFVANFCDQYPGIFDPDGDGERSNTSIVDRKL